MWRQWKNISQSKFLRINKNSLTKKLSVEKMIKMCEFYCIRFHRCRFIKLSISFVSISILFSFSLFHDFWFKKISSNQLIKFYLHVLFKNNLYKSTNFLFIVHSKEYFHACNWKLIVTSTHFVIFNLLFRDYDHDQNCWK